MPTNPCKTLWRGAGFESYINCTGIAWEQRKLAEVALQNAGVHYGTVPAKIAMAEDLKLITIAKAVRVIETKRSTKGSYVCVSFAGVFAGYAASDQR